MNEYLLIRYLHFIGVFAVVGALFAEAVFVKRRMSRAELRALSRVDSVYGMGALVAVTAGLLMWFYVGKPAAFYSSNWVFISKVALFGVVGLLSIWPTIFLIKNAKGDPNELVDIPKAMVYVIRLEVILLLVLPALAVTMASGYGRF